MKSLSTVKSSLDKLSAELTSLALSHALPTSVGHSRSQIQAKVLAVSKTKKPELIMEAYHAGHRDFGENYVRIWDISRFRNSSKRRNHCPKISDGI